MPTKFKLEVEGDLSEVLAHASKVFTEMFRMMSGTSINDFDFGDQDEVEPDVEDPSGVPDPVYGKPAPHGPGGVAASAPVPDAYPSDIVVPPGFDFGAMLPRPEAKELWERTIQRWLLGWDEDHVLPAEEDPPDRVELMRSMGEGQWPLHILRWVATYGCLQVAVLEALRELGELEGLTRPESLDFAERLAANLVQVSHAGFPDLAGFYDHSTKWKRELLKDIA